MITEKIISHLNQLVEIPWAHENVIFLASSKTALLTEKPGKYSVMELRAELEIRSKSAKNAGVKVVGITELQENISRLAEDKIIQNYVFKDEKRTSVVYLNENCEVLFGAVLVGDC